jgi:hypothetical protein
MEETNLRTISPGALLLNPLGMPTCCCSCKGLLAPSRPLQVFAGLPVLVRGDKSCIRVLFGVMPLHQPIHRHVRSMYRHECWTPA